MSDNPQMDLARKFLEQTGINVFLTGKAGTGKTTFLRDLRQSSPKRMIVVAPTGVAAINAGGVTIHSFFQLPFGPHLPGVLRTGGEKRMNFSKEKIAVIRSLDLLVIDDGSPDGTASVVKEKQQEYPGQLHLIERQGKLGLGTAYLTGFQWALEHGYDYIFEMDCDFSHNPDDLVRLLNAAQEGADLVIGSRYITGVNVVNWPMKRVLLSYYASAYVRLVTGMPVRDATAGFVCYSSNLLRSIDLDKIKMKGYGFQVEMKYTAWKLKFKVTEVPIIFTERTFGASKMSKGIFREALFGVLGLRFRKITPRTNA